MKKVKRLLASVLFSKHQKEHIWNSLVFSNHTYKRRGHAEKAEEVRRVMDSLEYIIKNELPRVYTQAELDEAIEDALRGAAAAAEDILQYEKQKAYSKGVRVARAEAEVTIDELQNKLKACDNFGVSVGQNLKGEITSVELIDNVELVNKLTAENQVQPSKGFGINELKMEDGDE